MGYSTTYTGSLKFKQEATASQLAKLNSILGEDCRNYPEWEGARGLFYISISLTNDFTGIEWNGTEKFNDMHIYVNVILYQMRSVWPEFDLVGVISAQGSQYDDRWEVRMSEESRLAYRRELPRAGQRITCPHCEEEFVLEGNRS